MFAARGKCDARPLCAYQHGRARAARGRLRGAGGGHAAREVHRRRPDRARDQGHGRPDGGTGYPVSSIIVGLPLNLYKSQFRIECYCCFHYRCKHAWSPSVNKYILSL